MNINSYPNVYYDFLQYSRVTYKCKIYIIFNPKIYRDKVVDPEKLFRNIRSVCMRRFASL